ncbi:MAG: response regulator [Bacteroidetes bacterium]|nr:response regulator [Bacteroidota bacterium]MCL2302729.1 response regulator [Lentimicrobiaceae bacterium]
MKKFRYIVIDDEYPSHLTVQHHFRAYLNYTCIATFISPKRALLFLQEHEIDLIFLDIKMPEMDGFQFLEALEKNIFVVILTAYPEKYSLDAHCHIDKNMVFFSNKAQFLYYLPKIIARFEKMHAEKEIINRINQLFNNEIYTFPKKLNNKPILLADILFITVIKHDIVLKMKDGKEIIDRITLRELMSFLPSNIFLQIKRNTIINTVCVTAFTNTTVCLEDQHFRISVRRQKKVIQTLKKQMQELYENY